MFTHIIVIRNIAIAKLTVFANINCRHFNKTYLIRHLVRHTGKETRTFSDPTTKRTVHIRMLRNSTLLQHAEHHGQIPLTVVVV